MGDIVEFPMRRAEQQEEIALEAITRHAWRTDLAALRRLAERPDSFGNLFKAIYKVRVADGEKELTESEQMERRLRALSGRVSAAGKGS